MQCTVPPALTSGLDTAMTQLPTARVSGPRATGAGEGHAGHVQMEELDLILSREV